MEVYDSHLAKQKGMLELKAMRRQQEAELKATLLQQRHRLLTEGVSKEEVDMVFPIPKKVEGKLDDIQDESDVSPHSECS
jgi:hypothetical protein